MKKLLNRLFGQKYYVWRSVAEKIWLLDFSGNDQRERNMVLVKTFRSKSWKSAQDRFNKIYKRRS